MLGLTACSSTPPPVAALPQPARTGPPYGIDMPNDARDVSNELKSSGLDFVARYFRGVAAGLASVGGSTQYKAGVYGSGAVWGYLKHMRLAQYAWLSNSRAWTGYNDFATWNIRHMPASAALSFGHDWNEATDDYGGLQVKSQYTAL